MSDPIAPALGLLFVSHPWHGVPLGDAAPDRVTVYVEMVPTDTVKYELDKKTGLLTVDRPQKYSNVPPCLYGFIPRTLCAEAVADLCAEKTGRVNLVGDMDPLDICVLTEKHIPHGNILVQAEPVGGLRMLDGNEVDDKLLAVLHDDAVYGDVREVSELSPPLLDRLRHYFLTYKQGPDEAHPSCEITHVYGRTEAHAVIARSQLDYEAHFGPLVAARVAPLKG